jgi:hypothetical protein
MQYGLTPQGYNRKPFEVIMEEMHASLRSYFGRSINLLPTELLGIIVGILSEREALVNEDIEDVYYSVYPDRASDINLDLVVTITGIKRNDATKSKVIATIYGTEGTLVPAGSVISVLNQENSSFESRFDTVIGIGTDEVQRIVFTDEPEEGEFTLNYDGEETDEIPFDATAQQVEDALNDLAELEGIEVEGSVAAGFDITFAGDAGQKFHPLLEIGTVNTLKISGTNEVQTISFSLVPHQGEFTLRFQGNETEAIPFDANADAVRASLEALANISVVLVAGDFDDGFQIEFSGLEENEDVPLLELGAINTLQQLDDPNPPIDIDIDIDETIQGEEEQLIGLVITEEVEGLLPNVSTEFEAQTAGAIPAYSGTLTVIETPVGGWDSVTNIEDAEIGKEIETDSELRLRRERTLAKPGSTTKEGILSDILNIDEIKDAEVYENVEEEFDDYGLPPKSFMAVALGSTDEEIGTIVWKNKAAGIRTYGNTEYNLIDSQGTPQRVFFSRPEEIDIYVSIVLTVDPGIAPDNIDDLVKQAIVDYSNQPRIFSIGQEVVVIGSESITTAIICNESIKGIKDIEIYVGLAADPVASDNIPIARDEIASFDTSRIEVEVEEED